MHSRSPSTPSALPFPATSAPRTAPKPARWTHRLRTAHHRTLLFVLGGFCFLLYVFSNELGTARRDLGYLTRPLWDSPERGFDVVSHFGRGEGMSSDEWCGMHGFEGRKGKPLVVDAVLVSTELDMLEIRWKEYEPFVDLFIVVESNMTFAGTPKRKYFAEQWNAAVNRFDFIPREKIIYLPVDGLVPDLPPGSFKNEATTRQHITALLQRLASSGKIPEGSLLLHSNIDEIISRDTLSLLTTCTTPTPLHLLVKNYRYSFAFPLSDPGYWRPKAITTTSDPGSLSYGHGRAGDVILADAGWHCSWCFRTLEEMRGKMLGYSHNDRVRNRKELLDFKGIRKRVCSGEEPFGMLPEAHTFRDLVIQSGPLTPSHTFRDVPVLLKQEPKRFGYLLEEGCARAERG